MIGILCKTTQANKKRPLSCGQRPFFGYLFLTKDGRIALYNEGIQQQACVGAKWRKDA